MISKINKYILGYAVICFLLCVAFLRSAYHQELIYKSPFINQNRDIVMGYFFYKYDKENLKNYYWWEGNNAPRWYNIVLAPSFAHLTKEQKKTEAKNYIETYIGDAFGLDENEIKQWLLQLIDYDNLGLVKLDKVFIKTTYFDAQFNQAQELYAGHLRNRITFIPLRQTFGIIRTEFPSTSIIFIVIFGLPILIVYVLWQLVFSAIAYINKMRG